jgi:hypothetical protein
MGYWAGKESKRYFVEGDCVYVRPGGDQVAVDPLNFEPVTVLPSPSPVVVEAKTEKVLEDFRDEKKIDEFVSGVKIAIEHLKECRTQGRGGKYTADCPKCDWLRKSK